MAVMRNIERLCHKARGISKCVMNLLHDAEFHPTIAVQHIKEPSLWRVIRKSGHRFSVRSLANYKISITFITLGRIDLK